MDRFLIKKVGIITFVLSVLLISAIPVDRFLQAIISNKVVNASLYLPDSENGYYRGSRFDWSGVIFDLEYKGHTYFGQWFSKYDPRLHDAIMGPVEEFSPLGYDEAKPGESFVKIGIGVMSKPNESNYTFATPYEILNHGKWEVKKRSVGVNFRHKLDDKNFSYEYEKNVQLVKGKSEMILSHTLKNTGEKVIETSVYNHNFFMFDNQLIGPDYKVKFSFPLSGGDSRVGDRAKILGNEIVFSRNLSAGENIYYGSLTGFSNNKQDYDIRIENIKTKSGVRITSDQPLSRLVFWSASTTLCPEPYVRVKVNPGETFSWNIFYNFYTL